MRRPIAPILLALASWPTAGAHASAITQAKAKSTSAASEHPFMLFGSNLVGSLVVAPTHGSRSETIPGLPYHFTFTSPNLPRVEHSFTAPFQGSGPGTLVGQYDAVASLLTHPAAATHATTAPKAHTVPGFLPTTTSLTNAPPFVAETPTDQATPAVEAQVIVVPEPSTLALAVAALAGLAVRRSRTRAAARPIR